VSLYISLSHSRSLKVIRISKWHPWVGCVCKSLLVFHWNYICTPYSFWDTDIQHKIMAGVKKIAWPWNRNLAYFQTPPANFLLSRPNAAEYCNSEKKPVKHRWLLYTCATFRELWRKNPWDPRAILLFLQTNRLGHVLFPFARWQHDYAQTALCIRRTRTRTRTLCIRRTLCRHVTIGTPMAIYAVLTVFWLFMDARSA